MFCENIGFLLRILADGRSLYFFKIQKHDTVFFYKFSLLFVITDFNTNGTVMEIWQSFDMFIFS